MPKVRLLWETVLNPASFIIAINFSGAGKRRTDAGKYSYAPLSPDIHPPIVGRILRKYNL
jgi:hypothetical protein